MILDFLGERIGQVVCSAHCLSLSFLRPEAGALFFFGKKWVRSLSSFENTRSRVVSLSLNL
jgi:hypothetical protein